jgi:hypothetical protein
MQIELYFDNTQYIFSDPWQDLDYNSVQFAFDRKLHLSSFDGYVCAQCGSLSNTHNPCLYVSTFPIKLILDYFTVCI